MSNNKTKKNNKIKGLAGTLFVLAIFVLTVYITQFKGGYTLDNTKESYDKYNSIEKMMSNTTMNIDLPSFVLNREDLEIRDTMGKIIEIGCKDFVLKIANFIDIRADVLGLYEKAENDIKYTVDNNETTINFVRYRTGYPSYTNCTLLNWCTDTTSYGVMLSGVYTEQEALELIGIKEDWCKLEESEKDLEVNINTERYLINNEFYIELPKFQSSVTVNDMDGHTLIYLDKKLCIAIVYNDLDKDLGTFNSQKCIQVDENINLYYREDNPFKEDSIAYNDYNTFISTISNVLESIVYQN